MQRLDTAATVGPPVMSPEFLRRAVREPASSNSDRATARTVQLMTDYIKKSAADPLVQRAAVFAVQQWRGGPFFQGDPFKSSRAIAESLWWFAKHYMTFVHHSALILVWLGEKDQLQLLISPDVLVRMKAWRGDCAIYSMLIPAMLEVLGVPWEIVTLAVNPEAPRVFSHVYPRAILDDGRSLALDASHGKYPGWSVPRRDIFRSQVWNSDAEPVDDVAQFDGLHNYVPARGMWGWSGLGDDTSIDTGVDVSGALTGEINASPGSLVAPGTYDLTSDQAAALDALYSSTPALSAETSDTPSAGGLMLIPPVGSSNWAAFVQAATAAGLNIATLQNLPAGSYYNTKTGQIVTGAGTAAAASLSSLTSNPMLLIGGGLLLFALLASSMKR